MFRQKNTAVLPFNQKLHLTFKMKKLFFLSLLCLSLFSNCINTKKEGDEQTGNAVSPTTNNKKTILCYGNSLTDGYGLDNPSEENWVYLMQKRIDSLQLPYNVVEAGTSGAKTSGGYSGIDFVLRQRVDVLFLELGANDAMNGMPLDSTVTYLQGIIDKTKQKYPDAKIVIAGMQAPPNVGKEYAEKFKAIFPALASKNKAALIPFLLENVAANPALNLKDGIHPNAEGEKIVLENVWSVMKGVL